MMIFIFGFLRKKGPNVRQPDRLGLLKARTRYRRFMKMDSYGITG